MLQRSASFPGSVADTCQVVVYGCETLAATPWRGSNKAVRRYAPEKFLDRGGSVYQMFRFDFCARFHPRTFFPLYSFHGNRAHQVLVGTMAPGTYHVDQLVVLKTNINKYELYINHHLMKVPPSFAPRVLRISETRVGTKVRRDLYMAKCPGKDLWEQMDKHEFHKRNLPLCLVICLELTNVLQQFYDTFPNFVHCDIKPENFMYDLQTGECRLLDFESARPIGRGLGTYGTPGFNPLDIKIACEDVDMHQLGVTIKYLITGVTPAHGPYPDYQQLHFANRFDCGSPIAVLVRNLTQTGRKRPTISHVQFVLNSIVHPDPEPPLEKVPAGEIPGFSLVQRNEKRKSCCQI